MNERRASGRRPVHCDRWSRRPVSDDLGQKGGDGSSQSADEGTGQKSRGNADQKHRNRGIAHFVCRSGVLQIPSSIQIDHKPTGKASQEREAAKGCERGTKRRKTHVQRF
jgi:hypothetical protein